MPGSSEAPSVTMRRPVVEDRVAFEMRKALRGAPAFLVFEAAGRLKGLILLPLLTRVLPLSEYGLYVQAIVVLGIGSAIAGFHFHQALVRFLPGAEDARRRGSELGSLFLLTVGGSVLATPVLCAAAVRINPALK